MRRVVVTGSTGLIGSALTASLLRSGLEVTRLVRRSPGTAAEVRWDPRAADGGVSPALLDGADAVIHLAGAGVADRRWTEARKTEIRASRVDGTRALVSVLGAMDHPPGVLLSASAIGWYGDTGQQEVDESAPAGTGFLADVVSDWEAAAEPAAKAGIRVVNLRTGLVLSRGGGMLARLVPPFRLGLGARLGPGTQYLSWITLTDVIGAIRFLVDRCEESGPVNLTAPEPVTNAAFTAALAAALHRPAVLRVPAVALRAGLGEVATELLGSARVLPRRLQQAGFSFRHPQLSGGLAAELAPGDPAA
jgi:uncharacterized protein (TIGR01777 family)